MNMKKETMKVITEGMGQPETCRIIDDISERAAESYKEAICYIHSEAYAAGERP